MSPPELQRAREKNPTLELKIISAYDVSLINVADKMNVYAVVSVTGYNIQKKQAAKTPFDFYGGSNPTWNHTVKFSLNEEVAILNPKVKLFSYWLEGENDLYLGEVNISVQDLLASNPCPLSTNGYNDKLKLVTFPVKITERTKGMLSFSYRLQPAVPVNDFYPSAPDYSLSYSQPINPNLDPASSSQPIIQSPLNLDPASSSQPIMQSHLQTTVTKLTLELMIKSAKDINKVSIGNEMSVYASVMIREGRTSIKDTTNTPIVYCVYRNPRWDHEVKFCLDEKLVLEGKLTLIVKLIGVRTNLGEKDVGEVKVPIQELFGSNPPSLPLVNVGGDDDNGMSLVTRGVSVMGSHKPKGTLSFFYRFLAEQAPEPFVLPKAKVGTSNTELPNYIQSQYDQSHGYQNYSPPHMESQLQKSQSQPQPRHQPLLHSQSQSQPYEQYSPPQL